jgi:Cys-rich protein (TIGR01571 family)
LKAGGTDALNALQTVSIAGGLVYTVILCFMCVSVWKVLKEEAGENNPDTPQFLSPLVAVLDFNSTRKWLNVLTAAFFPWLRGGQAAGKVYNQKSWPHMLVLALLMYTWIALEIAEVAEDGLAYIGWVVLFGFFVYLMAIRIAIRERSGIQGSMFEDALAVIFVYPLAVDQMYEHIFCIRDMEETQQQDADFMSDNHDKVVGIVEESRF